MTHAPAASGIGSTPVGAENRVTASDQRLRGQLTSGSRCIARRGMIARWGLPSRLSDIRRSVEEVGATGPVRNSQGHRDRDAMA
jgi:hypothetical protein